MAPVLLEAKRLVEGLLGPLDDVATDEPRSELLQLSEKYSTETSAETERIAFHQRSIRSGPLPAEVEGELHDRGGQTIKGRTGQTDELIPSDGTHDDVRVIEDPGSDLLAQTDLADVVALIEIKQLVSG